MGPFILLLPFARRFLSRCCTRCCGPSSYPSIGRRGRCHESFGSVVMADDVHDLLLSGSLDVPLSRKTSAWARPLLLGLAAEANHQDGTTTGQATAYKSGFCPKALGVVQASNAVSQHIAKYLDPAKWPPPSSGFNAVRFGGDFMTANSADSTPRDHERTQRRHPVWYASSLEQGAPIERREESDPPARGSRYNYGEPNK